MLKDVGMTVPKGRETRAVAYHDTLPTSFSFGLRILLLHALNPCVAAYIDLLPLFLYFLALSSLHPCISFYTLLYTGPKYLQSFSHLSDRHALHSVSLTCRHLPIAPLCRPYI